jgi:hypothetical protein
MRMSASVLSFLAAFGSLLLVAALLRAEDAPKPPAPVPNAAAQAAARKLVQDLYKADLARATKPEDKAALAKKLLQAALDTKDDDDGRYVLITTAIELAAGGRDTDTALAAATQMATLFQADSYTLKIDALSKVLAEARKVNDTALMTSATTRITELREAKASYDKLATSFAALEKDPLDPEANLAVGKFFCFNLGDWDRGLPMLVLGTDASLKGLAQKELAKPTETDKQIEVADGWWDAAGKMAATPRKTVFRHASEWYAKILPALTGLAKLKIEKKLQSLGGDEPAVSWTVLFRSSDPSIWNKDVNTAPSTFAMPLAKAPAGIQFLKMSVPAGAYVIIPMTNDNLGKVVPIGKGTYGWEGRGGLDWKGYHLGIYDKTTRKPPAELKGTVNIFAERKNEDYSGWGFGNNAGVDDKQGYAWKGRTVDPIVIEISVKTSSLTDTEKRFLLE